jgi:hypothetical protein
MQFSLQMMTDREKNKYKIQSAYKLGPQEFFHVLTKIDPLEARQHPNLRQQSPSELIIGWKM